LTRRKRARVSERNAYMRCRDGAALARSGRQPSNTAAMRAGAASAPRRLRADGAYTRRRPRHTTKGSAPITPLPGDNAIAHAARLPLPPHCRLRRNRSDDAAPRNGCVRRNEAIRSPGRRRHDIVDAAALREQSMARHLPRHVTCRAPPPLARYAREPMPPYTRKIKPRIVALPIRYAPRSRQHAMSPALSSRCRCAIYASARLRMRAVTSAERAYRQMMFVRRAGDARVAHATRMKEALRYVARSSRRSAAFAP